MDINEDDILVVPDHYEVAPDTKYRVHKMKHLLNPSIIKSGGYPMSTSVMSFSNAALSTKESLMAKIRRALGISENAPAKEEGLPLFVRHVREHNFETGELYPNRGATVLIDLDTTAGKFDFSFSSCHHEDLFCKKRGWQESQALMSNGEVFEVNNYDPVLSILDNIEIAIGVLHGIYPDSPLQDANTGVTLPEIVGVLSEQQLKKLSTLRRLIRNKA